MLCKLPKIRLGEALEFLEEVLDSTLTAQGTCDQDLLGIIMWLLTKIKPNLMISDLRCTRYIELYDRLRRASNRIKQCNAHDYNEVLSKLKLCHLDPTDVVGIAVTRGFEQHWLERKKNDTQMQGTKRQEREEALGTSRDRNRKRNSASTRAGRSRGTDPWDQAIETKKQRSACLRSTRTIRNQTTQMSSGTGSQFCLC